MIYPIVITSRDQAAEVGVFLSHLQKKIWKYCPIQWHHVNTVASALDQ